MSAADDSDIFIPSVFVGETGGQIILYDYMYLNGERWFHKQISVLITTKNFKASPSC